MKKKLFKTVVYTLLLFLVTGLNLDAKEVNQNSQCVDYSLYTDTDEVEAGREMKIILDYQSLEPACDSQLFSDEFITVDLSQLIGKYGEVNASYNTDIFNITMDASGLVTIRYNEYDELHNTLEEFHGSIVVTVRVSSEVVGDVVIKNDITSDIIVEVKPPSVNDDNTSKWADETYAKVGDTINYKIRVNTEENDVTNFKGIDTPASGLTYIKDSFYVTELNTGKLIDEKHYSINYTNNKLTIENETPFSTAYVLHYQMMVTANYDHYVNAFEAIYDTLVEAGSWDLSFDIAGSSEITFLNGYIDILKVNEDGESLSGAEFNIINADKKVVDSVITDDTGKARSIQLALGEYQVIETKAPDGYVIDSTPHPIELIENDEGIVQLEVENKKIENPLVETIDIEIHKLNEDGEYLADAEFDVINSSNQIVQSVITDEHGIAVISSLPKGIYEIVETKAPDGYVLSSEIYEVTADLSGEKYVVEVVNQKEKQEQNNVIDSEEDIEIDPDQNTEDSSEDVLVDEIVTDDVVIDETADSSEAKEDKSEPVYTLTNTGSNMLAIFIGITILLIGMLLFKRKLQ